LFGVSEQEKRKEHPHWFAFVPASVALRCKKPPFNDVLSSRVLLRGDMWGKKLFRGPHIFGGLQMCGLLRGSQKGVGLSPYGATPWFYRHPKNVKKKPGNIDSPGDFPRFPED